MAEVQSGAKIKFFDMDVQGHSVLPNFYWNFELDFTNTNVYDPAVLDVLGGGSSHFSIRCTSSEIPEAVHDIIMVDAKRFMFPEQGIIRRNGQITLTAFEANDARLMVAFHNVYNLLFSPDTGEMTNTGGQADDHVYKPNAVLRLYRNYNEFQDNEVATFRMKRIVFMNFNSGNTLGTGSTPDYFRPSMTIAYGNFSIDQTLKSGGSNIQWT